MSFESVIDTLEIRNANKISFVGTSSSFVDTTTGRIQTKGIQHNSNVITDVSGPHGRVAPTLKKYPEIAFESGKFDSNESTNTYVQAGYTVTDSSHHNEYYGAWIFDDQTGFVTNKNLWISSINTYTTSGGAGTPTMTTSDAQCTTVDGVATPGEWVQLKLPNKVKLSSISIMGPTDGNQSSGDLGRSPKNAVLAGSVDGTTWNSVLTWSEAINWTVKTYKSFPANVDSTNYYNYFRLIVTKNDGTQVYASIQELQLYGYEEYTPAGDHSVDTTFKSRFNNPQLTGVQVLVDGNAGQLGANQISGGADPSGNHATYVTDGKYWTLNGTLTSNLAVEANTFLEGDQPHAVSVWFNSSNLEANVSNTCVFSISDQEKLDSVNLDLQSNTWHNLTYAYQGEGGSRVAYLDGRKVLEDQAEDTFGAYPPFAMTGYSQGGYVVSASNEEDSTRTAYTLFNDVESEGNGWRDTGGTFQAGTGGHYRSNGTYDPATGIPRANLGSDSGGTAFATADEGEWVKIELPYKIKLNYFTLQPRNSTSIANGSNPSLSWGRSEFIKNGKIWGSNDGINWSVVHTISGTSASNDTAINSYTVGSSVAYKYFAIVITATNTSTSYASSTSLSEWELYGHRENDLVRLPDPTNVLKYPHIAMTGPAQRGYVASASGYNVGAGRPAWRAFDDLKNAGTLWQLSGTNDVTTNGYNLTPPYNANNNSPTINDNNNNPHLGAWIKLQLPRAIKLSSMNITATTAERRPDSAILLGSNDDSVWYVIKDTFSLVDQDDNTIPVSTSSYYKYVMFLIKSLSGNDGQINIHNIEYYGTEEASSVPIQIGGGNIDKVANFRVYDKFIGEDQVNEIWNAQKEEFGRAKPQMVLQQGKLGIGTDAPQGSLSVADEPDPDAYGLQEFPPKPLVGYKTHIEGHGEFCVSASSPLPGGGSYQPWYLFNKQFLGVNFQSTTWNSTTAFTSATGLVNSGAKLGNFSGEWVQLELPYKIKLKSFRLSIRQYWYQYAPGNYVIAAYDEDTTSWVELASYTGEEWEPKTGSGGDSEGIKNKHIGSTSYYKRYAIVISKLYNPANNRSDLNIAEWKLFGTREQLPPKQSVLHDGQLTLTKSLTVPRIGPAFGEYPTPRRANLKVEFDTSLAIHGDVSGGRPFSTSGQDFVYAYNNDAHYSVADKAFKFPSGTSTATDNLYGSHGFTLGTSPAHTQSLWIKKNELWL